jgi:hypothetical protein
MTGIAPARRTCMVLVEGRAFANQPLTIRFLVVGVSQ